jgi:mono/diheme cytochrome c family protein
VALGGCDAASSGKGLPPSSDPALDAGRVLIETKCSLCHTLDRIKAADHDGPAWEATIARMRQNGAVVTEAEAQSILNYLADR